MPDTLKKYIVCGTATVSVWVHVHANSPSEAIRKADSGDYEGDREYDTDGDPDYTSAEEIK